MPPAGWLPRTGISSGTLRSVIEYGLPIPLPFTIAFWVETIRIPRAEGCRPLGGANVASYVKNDSLSLLYVDKLQKFGSNKFAHRLRFVLGLIKRLHEFDIFDRSVAVKLLLNYTTGSQHRIPPTPYPPSSGIRIVLLDIEGGIWNQGCSGKFWFGGTVSDTEIPATGELARLRPRARRVAVLWMGAEGVEIFLRFFYAKSRVWGNFGQKINWSRVSLTSTTWFAGTLQCWRSTCGQRTVFAGAPFRLQNICRNGVPPRSHTTTPLYETSHNPHAERSSVHRHETSSSSDYQCTLQYVHGLRLDICPLK